MPPNPYQQYRATKVQTAGSVDLVVMLYQGAVKFTRIGIAAIERNDQRAAHGGDRRLRRASRCRHDSGSAGAASWASP